MSRRLTGKTIALSVSPPEDLAERGMGREHLNDALGEISRQVLALGARLIYGGHLGEESITKMLFELAARYAPSLARKDEYEPLIIDVVPYPWHVERSYDELMTLEADFVNIAQLRYMRADGAGAWLFAERPRDLGQLNESDWPAALTAMREYVTRESDARIVLGGKTKGYFGRMPGIAEEAFISASAQRPIFVVGGFGGAAREIAETIAAHKTVSLPDGSSYRVETGNGLDDRGLVRLATSPHIDEITVLITRGLTALFEH